MFVPPHNHSPITETALITILTLVVSFLCQAAIYTILIHNLSLSSKEQSCLQLFHSRPESCISLLRSFPSRLSTKEHSSISHLSHCNGFIFTWWHWSEFLHSCCWDGHLLFSQTISTATVKSSTVHPVQFVTICWKGQLLNPTRDLLFSRTLLVHPGVLDGGTLKLCTLSLSLQSLCA